MRISACIMALLAIAATAQAQEQTIFSGDIEHTGFGGPVLKYSRIHDQNALMVGGRGGWIINHTLVLGGGGYGVVSEIDAPAGALPLEGPLDIEFEYGGFEIEYIAESNELLHYSVYTLIGGGATNFVKDVGSVFDSNEQTGESDFMFVLEPAINGELNVMPRFRVNLGVSYRFVSGVEQAGLDDSDFSGLGVTATFKFGTF